MNNNIPRYTDTSLDPFVPPEELQAANRRHDEELRRMGIEPTPFSPIRPSWNASKMARRGLLTDRKIRAYQKAGRYHGKVKV